PMEFWRGTGLRRFMNCDLFMLKARPSSPPLGRPSLARFRLRVALSEGGFSSVGHLDPLLVRRGLGVVVVVPVPPLVRRGLGVTRWRVLPSLLPAERSDVEVAPGGPHR